MATNFPTSLDALTNPTGSDTLASPDHAGQHANANDAIEALQAKVGVDSSAVTTSLDYKVAQKIDKTLVDAKGDLIVASAADTVGRLAVGATNGHVLTVDSAQSLGVKWAAAATASLVGKATSYIKSPYETTSASLANNILFAVPLLIPKSLTVDRIAVRCTTFGNSLTLRLGIYGDSSGYPGSLLVDGGTVTFAASNTTYEVTVNQSLSAGWVWVAVQSNNNSTSTVLQQATTATAVLNPYFTGASGINNAQYGGLFTTSSGGTLPSTFVAVSSASYTNAVPIVALRLA